MSVADPEQPTAPSPPVHCTEGAVDASEPPPSGHLDDTSDLEHAAQSESPLRCHPDKCHTSSGEPCTPAEESHRLTETPTTPIARASILNNLSTLLLHPPRRFPQAPRTPPHTYRARQYSRRPLGPAPQHATTAGTLVLGGAPAGYPHRCSAPAVESGISQLPCV